MRTVYIVSLLALSVLLPANRVAQHREAPIGKTVTFQEGEYMRYYVAYGVIKAGEAELKIKKSAKNANDLHIVGTGKSYSFFDMFFKVRDTYETYFDPTNKVPTEFVRDINEGGYSKKQHYIFDHKNRLVYDNLKGNKTYEIDHDFTQDILSAFYYARLIDTKNLMPGDRLYIPTFLDEEMFKFYLEFQGREVLKTEFGKVNTLKFMPIVQKGRVFKGEETMSIWVTDDQNHMPVLLKSKLRVGAVRLELAEYKNLRYQTNFF
ncbi:MAG: DUF3108 domain-containing protein [Cryomorphaceae bacterium]|nr:DUF3108 domain-containing protein [Cryomorphaceae bacterium]